MREIAFWVLGPTRFLPGKNITATGSKSVGADLTCQISIDLKQHSRSGSGLCFVSHSHGVCELLRSLKLFYWIIKPLPGAVHKHLSLDLQNQESGWCPPSCAWLEGGVAYAHTHTLTVHLLVASIWNWWTERCSRPLLSHMDLRRWAQKLFRWLAQLVGWERQWPPVPGRAAVVGVQSLSQATVICDICISLTPAC